MYKNQKILAIIPARKGSKRLPKKNILLLGEKPLIAWTIESALKSSFIDTLIISSDDELIVEISKKYGAKVPFIRPKELSTDTSATIDVILHAIDFYKEMKEDFKYVMLLQPTSPLRGTQDIDNAIKMLDPNTKAVVSVCKTEHSPLWTNTLPKSLSMKEFLSSKNKNKRSQDLPDYYRLNGAIYIAEIDYLIKNNDFFGSDTFAYIMGQERSVDIDTKIDFELCKIILNENN